MWSMLDDVTYMSYSFTLDIIYNLCIYTKDFSARKVKPAVFMSGDSKGQFVWQVKDLSIVLSGGNWEIKQAEEMQNGKWHQFWHWITSNSQAFPTYIEKILR